MIENVSIQILRTGGTVLGIGEFDIAAANHRSPPDLNNMTMAITPVANFIITVVKNGEFSTIIYYDNKRVRLCHCCIPLNFLDFKDLKKLKKANEGRQGQMKGQNI